MSGVALTIETSGLEALQQRLDRLCLMPAQLRGLLEEIGEAVDAQTRLRFDEQKNPDGEPWAPSGRVLQDGGQILVDKAVLKNSIGYQAEVDQVRIGTNLIYAATHQMGDEDRNIEARAFLGISDADYDEIEQLVDDFIIGLLK